MSGDALLGTVLADRYRLDVLLGEGGMGRVYAAEHVLMRKRLAVKILHRQLTQVPEVVARFEREAMAAAHIDHPNIAAATDFGKLPDGSVYLVLEFVEGRSLRDEVARGPMPAARALHIARQIAAALAAAHALEIVHRDLKPENVMLVQKGADPDFAKVLDFGIAKVPMGEVEGDTNKPITKAGMVYGTPEYMAPEQALGQAVDGRADLFAFGVMLFEMIAGVRPYVAKNQVAILGQMLSQPVPTFSQRAPGVSVPPAVESFVHRLLAREADERIQSAAEAYVCIEALLGSVPAPDSRLFTLAGGSPTSVIGGPSSYRDSAAHMPSALLSRASAPSLADSLVEASRPSALRSGAAALAPDLLPSPPPAVVGYTTAERLVTRLQEAAKYLDTKKGDLPAPLGTWAQAVPGRVLLGALAFGVLGIVTAVVAVVLTVSRGDGAESSSAGFVPVGSMSGTPEAQQRADAPQDPLQARLERADQEGLAAVEALAKELPSEGAVLVALARARAKASDFEGAVAAVSDALAIDPKLNESPRIAGVLFRSAQAPAASSATFRLLEGPMGTRGADIVYDLAHTRGVRPAVKATAEKLLRSKDFQLAASPALEVAVALRRAQTCAEFSKLLQQAKNVGDARSLEFLRPLTSTTGCGAGKKGDCYECLRKTDALQQTIVTIEKRSATQKPRAE